MNVQRTPSFFTRHQFLLLLIAAILLRYLPFVGIPIQWLESYFHEISHGIAALATGGSVVSIQLFPNGAGLCTSRGGIAFVTSFMGYTGAILWGILIYSVAKSHRKMAQVIAGLIIAILLLSMVFWVRDLLTVVILLLLMALFAVTFKIRNNGYFQLTVQLIGLSVLLNGLFSPTYLIDGRHLGDGAALASMTGVPEILWVLVWMLFAGAALYLLYHRAYKKRS